MKGKKKKNVGNVGSAAKVKLSLNLIAETKVELQQSECVSRTSFSPLTTFRIEARSAPTDNILQRAISHVTSTPSYPVGMIREFTL